ncbi:MAG: glycoside hydrolase family protein [Nitrospirae bacterium]|nr:glycoside hydrolase family protein [Nitrospirota bacterium]MCL5238651.1 glycoside hydrolase family protein [Nitrospirota bacterium]
MRESIVDMLKRHEGLRLKPYLCPAGKLTIGVGRNIEDRGFDAEEKEKLFGNANIKPKDYIERLDRDGITEDQAMYLLRNDISQCMTKLRATVQYFDKLSEARQDVLINLCFNMGLAGLMDFRKMFAAMKDGKYEEASDEMIRSRWAQQVGVRASELSGMMRKG